MTKSHNSSPNYSKKLTSKDFTELLLKIDLKLKLLQDFWDKYQDFLNKNAWLCTKKQNQPIIDDLNEPLSVSEVFRRNAQVVINQSTWETAEIGFLESENLPRWHRNVFDNPKFFSSLSEEARKGVLQFYDNLDSITSIYEKIKSLGLKVVRRTNLNEQLERLVTETLTQGNPLNGTQPLAAPDRQSGEVSSAAEAVKPFPCKAGTKWEDVKITLVDNENVRVETPQGKMLCHYIDLNMKDIRCGRPRKVWATLELFAKNQGIFPLKYHTLKESLIKALPEKTKHLNSHLKKLFGIEESIFKHHYNKHKRYETRIFFSDQTISCEPEQQEDKSPFVSELDEINKKFGTLKESV